MTTHSEAAARYGLLHYPGNVTADVHAGQLLGHDEAGRYFAVIDTEFDPVKRRTDVHLQYATPEQIRAAFGEAQAELAKPRPSFSIFRQPVGITAVAAALAEQARHVEARRVRRHNRAAAQR